jgi:hypothetical protein
MSEPTQPSKTKSFLLKLGVAATGLATAGLAMYSFFGPQQSQATSTSYFPINATNLTPPLNTSAMVCNSTFGGQQLAESALLNNLSLSQAALSSTLFFMSSILKQQLVQSAISIQDSAFEVLKYFESTITSFRRSIFYPLRQGSLLNKVANYIELLLQQQRLLPGYTKEMMISLKYALNNNGGFCNGIANTFALAALERTHKPIAISTAWFFAVEDALSSWDRKPESLQKKIFGDTTLQQALDTYIPLIHFYQEPSNFTNFEHVSALESHKFLNDTLGAHPNNTYVISGAFSLEQAQTLLEELQPTEEEALIITSHNHATTIVNIDKTFQHFNANNPVGSYNTKDLTALVMDVIDAHFRNQSPTPSFYPLGFNIITFGKVRNLPNQHDLLKKINASAETVKIYSPFAERYYSYSSLGKASWMGDKDSMRFFLTKELGTNPNPAAFKLLVEKLISNDNIAALRQAIIIFGNQIDLNTEYLGDTLLSRALNKGDFEFVKFLKKHGAHLDKDCIPKLIEEENFEILNELVSIFGDKVNNLKDIINYAITHNNLDLMQTLSNPKIFSKNTYDKFIYEIVNNYKTYPTNSDKTNALNFLRMLLKNGADPDIRTKNKYGFFLKLSSAREMAKQYGLQPIIKLFAHYKSNKPTNSYAHKHEI